MTAMNWTTLTASKSTAGSIKRWVNYDKVDPEEVIAEAEAWMAIHLRVMDMQARVDDLALAEDASSIDLSTDLPDFLDPISVFLVGQGYLRYVAEDEIDQMRWPDPTDQSISAGTPCRYAMVGRTMLFDCQADDDYTLILNYYARPTALSGSNETSLYTDATYRLIFKQALLGHAYQLPKDERRAAGHIQYAEALIMKQQSTDDLVRRAQEQFVRVRN